MLKDYKSPDVKAPRYRQRATHLLDEKMFRAFIKKHPEHKGLTYAKFRSIIKTNNTISWNKVIEHRDGVELPHSLGCLFVATCKQKKRPDIDWNLSSKYSKQLRNRSFESDNHLAKIFYTTFANKYKFKNREVWTFVAIRQFKRGVAATYPKLWKQYIVIEPFTRISEIFKGHMIRDWRIKQVKSADLTNYDEFNLD